MDTHFQQQKIYCFDSIADNNPFISGEQLGEHQSQVHIVVNVNELVHLRNKVGPKKYYFSINCLLIDYVQYLAFCLKETILKNHFDNNEVIHKEQSNSGKFVFFSMDIE